MLDLREATTGEADAYRAGFAEALRIVAHACRNSVVVDAASGLSPEAVLQNIATGVDVMLEEAADAQP